MWTLWLHCDAAMRTIFCCIYSSCEHQLLRTSVSPCLYFSYCSNVDAYRIGHVRPCTDRYALVIISLSICFCIFFFALKAILLVSAIAHNPTNAIIHRLCVYPYTRVVFLQIFHVKGSKKFFSLERFQNISITRNTSIYLVRPLPSWWPFVELRIFRSYRLDQFTHQVSLGKTLNLHFFIIPSGHSSFICFNIYKNI